MTTMIVLNIAFAAVVLAGLIALLGFSVATQHRDLGVTLERRGRNPRQISETAERRAPTHPVPAPRWGAATRRRSWPAV